NDMMRMAQRLSASSCVLLTAIFLLHPAAQHHGYGAWVLGCQCAGRGQVFLITAHLAGTTLCGFQRSTVVFQFLGFLLQRFLGLSHVVEDGSTQATPQENGRSNNQDVLEQFKRKLD